MTPESRQQCVLAHEAQAIHIGAQHGPAEGAEIVKGAIDGSMNGLVRMLGPKEASIYAYALADRVVGGVRAPTPVPELEPVELPKIVERPRCDLPAWVYLAIGAVVMWVGMRVGR